MKEKETFEVQTSGYKIFVVRVSLQQLELYTQDLKKYQASHGCEISLQIPDSNWKTYQHLLTAEGGKVIFYGIWPLVVCSSHWMVIYGHEHAQRD